MKKFIQGLLLATILTFTVSNAVTAQTKNNDGQEQVSSLAGNSTVTTVAYAWATYYGDDQGCYQAYGVTWSQLNGMIMFMYMLNSAAGNWFVQQSVYSVPPSL